jgi:ATP-binding cassette subfamily C protein
LVELEGKIAGLVFQLVQGVGRLRVAGAELRAFQVWADAFAHQRRLTFRARLNANWLEIFNSAFIPLGSIAVFAVAASRLQGDNLSVGQFLAFFAAFTQFFTGSLGLSSALTSILAAVPTFERLQPILATPPESDEAKADPGELSGEIEISRASFRYSADAPYVLKDTSLFIKAGEFVAFVGPSGVGKSTLFRLLLGFEAPESGSIYYDGQDLEGLDVQAVRRQTGVVLQQSQLIPGDIFTNIIGSAPLTLDDAWEAARMSGLEEDIKRMPMQMHTVISEGGATFSGGQRQRLMIARAVVRKPRILLFDEATSALDNRTQSQVSESLERLQATRIVIAHRLSTIINADRIYVLGQGGIVQQGTYQELISQPGPFAELARRQLA